MTVRSAELAMGIFMLLASIGIMVKSAELNIGWIPGRGPGAGAWPFWLAAGMALSCIATLIRWALRITPESRNTDQFIARETIFIVLVTVLALTALLLAIHAVGMYFALMAFLLFYVRFVGRHDWFTSVAFMVGVPVFVFCLFEWALTTSLPKGWDMFEPLYYPLYDLIYGTRPLLYGALINGWIYGAIAVGALAQRSGRNALLVLLVGLVATPIAGAAVYAMSRPASDGNAG